MNLATRATPSYLVLQAVPATASAVNGPAIGRDSLLIGAGAAVYINDRVSVYAYYDGNRSQQLFLQQRFRRFTSDFKIRTTLTTFADRFAQPSSHRDG